MPPQNAYIEGLRKKLAEALKRGNTKSEAARTIGVSRSSVKRYAKMTDEGRSLAPKKRPGSRAVRMRTQTLIVTGTENGVRS